VIAFEQPYALLLLMPLMAGVYKFYASEKDFTLLHISRALIAVLAVALLAQPMIASSYMTDQQSITLLKDDSASTEIIDYQKPESSQVSIREQTVDAGNPDETTSSILNHIQEDRTYLISSDLRIDQQRLEDGVNERNATLHLVKYSEKDEISVSIKGPEESYISAENSFAVQVSSTAEKHPVPEVRVEGEEVELEETEENTYTFGYSFDDEGRKKISASINSEDKFSENNKYYHVVDVQEKPDILYVENRIEGSHNNFLDTDYVQEVPDKTEKYDTLVVNRESASDLESSVIQGQNVLYTGPAVESNYLPVEPSQKSSQDSETFESARVAIVIDISVSNTQEIRNNKAIALNTIDGLPSSSRVAIVAYNDEPYLLSELTSLQNNRGSLKNTVKSIETKGPTDHAVGLNAGRKALSDEGNIVMITDGGLKTDAPGVENVRERTLRAAANTSTTVNVVDTQPQLNPDFLKQISRLSDGIYTSASSESPLSFVFDSQTSESGTKVATIDDSHPITENHDSTVFTEVAPTSSQNAAQELMVSSSSTPYLSTWRYGIGKVATITDKDPSLNSLASQDPQILLNTFQWLSDSSEEEFTVSGARQPFSTEVRSSEKFEGAEQLNSDTFIRQVNFNSTGIKQIAGRPVAYNYPIELEKVGYSNEIEKVVNSSGGDVLQQDSGRISEIANKQSATESRSIENPLLIALGVIFLLEIGYRKRNRLI
jgi:hypothetical protein